MAFLFVALTFFGKCLLNQNIFLKISFWYLSEDILISEYLSEEKKDFRVLPSDIMLMNIKWGKTIEWMWKNFDEGIQFLYAWKWSRDICDNHGNVFTYNTIHKSISTVSTCFKTVRHQSNPVSVWELDTFFILIIWSVGQKSCYGCNKHLWTPTAIPCHHAAYVFQ